MVDHWHWHAAVINCVMPCRQSYLYDMGGELHWPVSYAAADGLDDFADQCQWFAGGSCEGTLTVWGPPAAIGGTSEAPLATQRLKHARDGQEDLVYMAPAADASTFSGGSSGRS